MTTDQTDALAARLRSGELHDDVIDLAAHVGHAGALELRGRRAFDGWDDRLARAGDRARPGGADRWPLLAAHPPVEPDDRLLEEWANGLADWGPFVLALGGLAAVRAALPAYDAGTAARLARGLDDDGVPPARLVATVGAFLACPCDLHARALGDANPHGAEAFLSADRGPGGRAETDGWWWCWEASLLLAHATSAIFADEEAFLALRGEVGAAVVMARRAIADVAPEVALATICGAVRDAVAREALGLSSPLAAWAPTAHALGVGRARMEEGDLAGASAVIDRLIAREPEAAMVRLRRAELRMRAGDITGAREDLDRALDADHLHDDLPIGRGSFAELALRHAVEVTLGPLG